jgi:hypothetical protein
MLKTSLLTGATGGGSEFPTPRVVSITCCAGPGWGAGDVRPPSELGVRPPLDGACPPGRDGTTPGGPDSGPGTTVPGDVPPGDAPGAPARRAQALASAMRPC